MTTLGITVLLSCAFFLLCTGDRAPIPAEVLARLRSMNYHGDIHNIGLKIVPMPMRDPAPAGRNMHNNRSTPVIMTGSLMSSNNRNGGRSATAASESDFEAGSGGGSSGGNIGEVVELINNPKQASNSCEKREICVPVPVDDHDASIFIFPQCIELPQCLGSCCDSFQTCHPLHVVPVKVAVKKYQYSSTGELHEVNQTYVLMAKHMDCGCAKCEEENVVCKGNQVRKECACRCANEQEAVNCNTPWKWSNDECKCECTIQNCANGESLSEKECKCFPAMLTIRTNAGNESTDIVRAPRVLHSDVSILPRLKPNLKSGRRGRNYH